ncbi:hypothetical protein DFJ74DRAFT_723930, partial [Hyaloraphidium curvatum]
RFRRDGPVPTPHPWRCLRQPVAGRAADAERPRAMARRDVRREPRAPAAASRAARALPPLLALLAVCLLSAAGASAQSDDAGGPSRRPGQCPPDCTATIRVCGSGSSADLRFLACICTETYLAAFDKCAALCLSPQGGTANASSQAGLSGYAVRVRCAQVGFAPPPGEGAPPRNTTWLGLSRPHLVLRGPAGNPPPAWYGTASTASASPTTTPDASPSPAPSEMSTLRISRTSTRTFSRSPTLIGNPVAPAPTGSAVAAAAAPSDGGFPTWALALICALAGSAAVIVALGVWFCCRHRNKREKPAAAAPAPEMSTTRGAKSPTDPRTPTSPRSVPPPTPLSASSRTAQRTPTSPPSYSTPSPHPRSPTSPAPSYQTYPSSGGGARREKDRPRKQATFEDPSASILDAYAAPAWDDVVLAGPPKLDRDRMVRATASDSVASRKARLGRIDTGVARGEGPGTGTPRDGTPFDPRYAAEQFASGTPASARTPTLDKPRTRTPPDPAPADLPNPRERDLPPLPPPTPPPAPPTPPSAPAQPPTPMSASLPPLAPTGNGTPSGPRPAPFSSPATPSTPLASPTSALPSPIEAFAALGLSRPRPTASSTLPQTTPTPEGTRWASFAELRAHVAAVGRGSEDGSEGTVGGEAGGRESPKSGRSAGGSSGTVAS